MNKALAVATLLACAAPAGAQIGNTMEGEAILGLAGQNDVRQVERLRLSPVGLNIGFIVQPLFGRRSLSLVEQVSFYPVVFYERSSFFDPGAPRTNPLILNTVWFRIATNEPEEENKFVYFAGGGASFAISTPRGGDKISPMLGVGVRRWFPRQLGLELSLQCTVLQVGRTVCQLPFTSVWPFG